MKLSIIIAIRMMDEYVLNCIDSIVSQDYKDYEVIVIDEEDTDHSQNLLSKYNNISNINVYNYNLNNKPVMSSLNYGLSLAKGEYVMFTLASDYYKDGFLSDLMSNIMSNDLMKFDYTLLKSNNILEQEYTTEVISKNGKDALQIFTDKKDPYMMLNKYVIKRDLLDNIELSKDDFYSDLTIVPYLIMKSSSFYNSELTGYMYRMVNDKYRSGHLNSPEKLASSVIRKYDYLLKLSYTNEFLEDDKKFYLDLISRITIDEAKILPKEEKKKYKSVLKKGRIKNNIIKKGLF